MTLSRFFATAVLGLIALLVIVAVASNVGGNDGDDGTISAGASDGTAQPEISDAEETADSSETDESATDSDAPAEAGEIEPSETEVAAPPVLRPRPELIGLDGWLQSPYESLDDLDGKVYIVEFWTFGCFNCKAVKPHLRALYDEHQADGLEIIGVHSPEFDFEKDVDAIQQAADDQRVNWPIALDTNKRSFRHWQEDRRFWPRTYVVDQNGDIRYDHIGEGAYDELGETVEYLLEHGA